MQVDLGLVSAVATAVAILVELQRADVAAAANFASLVGGNFEAVRDQALTMVDQVWCSQMLSCLLSVLMVVKLYADCECCACLPFLLMMPWVEAVDSGVCSPTRQTSCPSETASSP